MPDGDRAMRARGENSCVTVRVIDRAGCVHAEFLLYEISLFFRLKIIKKRSTYY